MTKTLGLALLLFTPLVHFSARASTEEQSREAELYQRGTEALDDQDYREAVEAFSDLAEMKGSRADAALYWKAYALQKLGDRAQALATVESLKKAYPSSNWLKDARALEMEIQQSTGQAPNPNAESDLELKLLALNGLMHMDSEQAVPLLEKFLADETSPKLRERALFVLAQSGSARAREVMAEIARGKLAPGLQMKAIHNLGIFGGAESRQILSEVYASSSDVAVKKAILRSFMVSGEKDRLLQAAQRESSPELRGTAIDQLGVMGAHDELWGLYQAESSVDLKKKIIRALFVGGASERLTELAKTEKDPALRRSAIHNLGLTGAARSSDALVSIYASDSDPAIKKEVIRALFVSGNAKALVDLARKENDKALQAEIVRQLSLMNSKEGTEYLLEILRKK